MLSAESAVALRTEAIDDDVSEAAEAPKALPAASRLANSCCAPFVVSDRFDADVAEDLGQPVEVVRIGGVDQTASERR